MERRKLMSTIIINGKSYEVTNDDGHFTYTEPINFPEGMFKAIIDDELKLVEPVVAYSDDALFRFTFAEVPEEVVAKDRQEAQIEYTALMTDTLLEEE